MLANEWDIAPISDLLEREFPGEWGVEPNGQGNAKVLRSTNLDDDGHLDYEGGAERDIPKDKLRSKQLKLGDILLEASGGGPGKPVGRVAIFGPPDDRTYLCSNFFRVLRPSKAVFPKYLLWCLLFTYRNPRIWAFQQQTTGIINLKVSEYLWHVLTWPPLSEQRRIAEILDTADRAIGETEALISKLKQMKTGLMQDLLTRGLDERGELRDPDAHPEQFNDSPLGRIPREWNVLPLGNIAEMVTSGSRGWARYYSDEGPMFLRIGNLTREHINLRLNDLVHVRPPTNGEGSRTQVREGDLLISITADLGIVGVIPEHLGEAYVNQHIALVRLDYSKANPRWVGVYLAGNASQNLFYRLNDSGAKAGLNLPTISALPVALPDSYEQHRIAEILDAQDSRIHAEEAYRDKLKLQKKGLMDDLLTGRVRVKTAQEVGA